MDLGVSKNVEPLLAAVRNFIAEEIAPVEEEYIHEISVGDRWQFTDRQTEIMETLKDKSKSKGLWNFFLTEGDHELVFRAVGRHAESRGYSLGLDSIMLRW